MRVLVLSLNAWNLSNSTGNTLSNLFCKLNDSDKVANIYCRNERVDNSICKRYFRITESDIIHSLFTLRRCGREMSYKDCGNERELQMSQRTNYENFFSLLKNYRCAIVLLFREFLWSLPVWKNKKLKKFVTEFSPEVIYMHGHYNLYMHWILSYCQKISGAKVAMYWADDMYGRKSYSPINFFYESLLRKRFRKSILLSSLLFGGSLPLCKEYSHIFGKQFIPFIKECKRVKFDDNKYIGNPIIIVYAGNLLFGRENVIVELAKAIGRINRKGLLHQYFLKIFSNTTPSTESLLFLDDKRNCCYMGCKPYQEVCEEMDRSDLSLFIESFDKNNILSTRLSFSTKIIDCMQSSAGILAIGPSNIASIDYIENNKLGYTITDVTTIEHKLIYLAENPGIIKVMNRHKFEFAKRNHTNTSSKAIAEIRGLL